MPRLAPERQHLGRVWRRPWPGLHCVTGPQGATQIDLLVADAFMIVAPLLWSSSLVHAQTPIPRQHIAGHRRCAASPALRHPPPRCAVPGDSTRVSEGLAEADRLARPEAAQQPSRDDLQRSRADLWRYDRAAVERGGLQVDGTRRDMLEGQVGIRCWTDDLPGFSGILKQRCGSGMVHTRATCQNAACSLALFEQLRGRCCTALSNAQMLVGVRVS